MSLYSNCRKYQIKPNLQIFIFNIIGCFLVSLIPNVVAITTCGTPICFSSRVIEPNVPFIISWHTMDQTKKIQLSLLEGNTAAINDCHVLNDYNPVLHWVTEDSGTDTYNITLSNVPFEFADKTYMILLNYLSTDTCMMGPEGSGDSYITIAKNMPIVKNNGTNGNNDGSSNNNNNNNNNNIDGDKTNGGDNLSNDNGKNDIEDHDGLSTWTLILILIMGAIILFLLILLLLFYHRRSCNDTSRKVEELTDEDDSLKQNSKTHILPPNFGKMGSDIDDPFSTGPDDDSLGVTDVLPSITTPTPTMTMNTMGGGTGMATALGLGIGGVVNLNSKEVPPIPGVPNPAGTGNENYMNNISVESFNSANSQSCLISRHEAKMIAERFRRELQNPLNQETDDASSIKDKDIQ